MNKSIIVIALLLALVVGVIGGHSFWPQSQIATVQAPVGSTFNTAKIASIVFNPQTGTATSTSILNTDADDRIIQSSFFYCDTIGTSRTAYTGTGLAVFTFTAATTSTSAPGTITNTNLVMSNTMATATTPLYNASSTIGTADFGRIWATGSYLSFASNATNTASCVIGVNYLAS